MLSVVIPLHNLGYKGDYCLKRCLDSILAQTYNDYEVLLMENGSTDDTIKIAEEYCKKDNRFKLHILDTIGVSNARNKGIEIAKGEYITFIDGDDFISNDYLMSAYNLFSNQKNATMVIMNKSLYYKNKIIQYSFYNDNTYDNMDKFNIDYHGSMCDKIIKTKFIKNFNLKYNTSLTHGEDGLFAYELLFLSDKIITSASGMYYYVQNRKGQATSSSNNVLSAEIPTLIEFKKLTKKYNEEHRYNKNITARFITLFVGGKFAQTQVTKMGLLNLIQELNKYKQLIIEWHIDFNTINNKWQKIWFTRFINILKTSTVKAALFLKFMRIYRNIFIQTFKIKWYK